MILIYNCTIYLKLLLLHKPVNKLKIFGRYFLVEAGKRQLLYGLVKKKYHTSIFKVSNSLLTVLMDLKTLLLGKENLLLKLMKYIEYCYESKY